MILRELKGLLKEMWVTDGLKGDFFRFIIVINLINWTIVILYFLWKTF